MTARGSAGYAVAKAPRFVYVCVKDLYRCVSQREIYIYYFHRLGHCGTDTARHVKHEHCSRNSIRPGTEQQRQSNKAKQQQQPQPRRRRHRLHQGPIPPQPQWHQEYSVTQLQVCTKTHLGYGQVDQNISEPENGSKKCCILCCAQQLQYIMYKR